MNALLQSEFAKKDKDIQQQLAGQTVVYLIKVKFLSACFVVDNTQIVFFLTTINIYPVPHTYHIYSFTIV